MKRSKRLSVVLQLFVQQEEKASQNVQMARVTLEQQQNQLRDLVAYQEEYYQSVTGEAQQTVSIMQWRRLQDYIEQLKGIIAKQEYQVQLAEVDVQRAQDAWQQAYLKRKSLEGMVEKVVMQETLEADKKEQKNLDELVQQLQQSRYNRS
ncbi:flagellar export protein FliJ [Salinispirillum sp. LH 10-3-1]|uniref:Flagellar FliJ protein n=1 Tax=Salinispirillum sp. LH 10-3-1 TaxID=2952525 RepID=A0AB38YCG4_9GAMM